MARRRSIPARRHRGHPRLSGARCRTRERSAWSAATNSRPLQTFETFDRLSAIVMRRHDRTAVQADPSDPLLAACQIVAEAVRSPFVASPRPAPARHDFIDVIEIARIARLRVRRTLLRGDWWTQDVGPLLAWHGEQRHPVALLRGAERRRGYPMIDPVDGNAPSASTGRWPWNSRPKLCAFYPGPAGAPASISRDLADLFVSPFERQCRSHYPGCHHDGAAVVGHAA